MSILTRQELTSKIETFIHDNNSKEVTASNVREVLKDFRDSNFNIDDDELRTMKYNSTQTLEEYLNSNKITLLQINKLHITHSFVDLRSMLNVLHFKQLKILSKSSCSLESFFMKNLLSFI